MDGIDYLSQALRELTPTELGELIHAHDMVYEYVIEMFEEGLGDDFDDVESLEEAKERLLSLI